MTYRPDRNLRTWTDGEGRTTTYDYENGVSVTSSVGCSASFTVAGTGQVHVGEARSCL